MVLLGGRGTGCSGSSVVASPDFVSRRSKNTTSAEDVPDLHGPSLRLLSLLNNNSCFSHQYLSDPCWLAVRGMQTAIKPLSRSFSARH